MPRPSVLQFLPVLALAAGTCTAATSPPVFGSVVPIGGTASDIALDETHGVLYIADFAGSAIDVMSLANNTLTKSYSALPYPGSIAVSPGGQYLVAAHYGNGTTTPQGTNAVSVITIATNARQVFNLPYPALAISFAGNGTALIVTTNDVRTMDPATGNTTVLGTFTNLAMMLPVPLATFPGQILQAAMATSADGNSVWGIGSANTGSQMIYRYYAPNNTLEAVTYTSTPAILPRISSSADGTTAMAGYSLINAAGFLQGRYPHVLSSPNITGVAIDSAHGTNGLVYAQLPDTNQSTGPGSVQPWMVIMDADNLSEHERINIPEDMVGRAMLNAAGTVLYAVSESGVMVLPVGLLNTYHRVARGQADVLVSTSFCGTGPLTQTLAINDPGGGHTDFSISTTQAGVKITPSSGTTPATVTIQVDPAQFPLGGTTTAMLTITSASAVNRPAPVRLLVNKPDPSQRGTIVDQPGLLSDILADTARNRFYVLNQDANQLLVFDGPTQKLIATLRTATTPTMMGLSSDQNFLLVGHNDSQLVTVYDLNALAPSTPIVLPGGRYARSIAASTNLTLVLERNEGQPDDSCGAGCIESVNVAARTTAPMSLGIYKNNVSPESVLAPSPSGGFILMASPDGNVLLYNAAATGGFPASRKDSTGLSGAAAASDFGTYVAGANTLDSSLVPSGTLALPSGVSPSGFIFTGQGGYLAAAASPSSSGTFQIWSSLQGTPSNTITMVEAPLLPVTIPPSSNSNAYALTAFTRTIAPLPAAGIIVVLTTSGFTMLAPSYPAVPPPTISGVASAADGNTMIAPGEWISIYGQNLSSVALPSGQMPLATNLGNSCVTANGVPVPLLFVSPGQINAQLPYSVAGGSLVVHTTVGASAGFPLTVASAAPSVFSTGLAGTQSVYATIYRDDNGQLVTPTNPIHPKNYVTIFLTGMGTTSPSVVEGQPAPSSPLAYTTSQPALTLGSVPLTVTYAGLTPGEIGVYQINAYVPTGLQEGLSIPLTISQGGETTTLYVRVVTN